MYRFRGAFGWNLRMHWHNLNWKRISQLVRNQLSRPPWALCLLWHFKPWCWKCFCLQMPSRSLPDSDACACKQNELLAAQIEVCSMVLLVRMAKDQNTSIQISPWHVDCFQNESPAGVIITFTPLCTMLVVECRLDDSAIRFVMFCKPMMGLNSHLITWVIKLYCLVDWTCENSWTLSSCSVSFALLQLLFQPQIFQIVFACRDWTCLYSSQYPECPGGRTSILRNLGVPEERAKPRTRILCFTLFYYVLLCFTTLSIFYTCLAFSSTWFYKISLFYMI